ncbi:MAG: nickel-dependent hydrogenase large subunit, partial [Bacteroidales bacterium]|nr:nickel-dependent hydrogenase large subunit [Bacteroidales bacterium]
QYPHNSYAVVGGITTNILPMHLVKVENYIFQVIRFFQQNLVNVDIEKFLLCENIEHLFSQEGELPDLMNLLLVKGLDEIGKSYDQFVVFGNNSYFKSGKSIKTRVQRNVDIKFVEEFDISNSKAKNVMYKNKYYEVGPLSRAMINKTPLIKDAHRRYGDSVFSRILARICEIPQLLHHSLYLLQQIDCSEPSYIKPEQKIQEISAKGSSAIEAARGSLIHKVKLHKGIIQKYEIITPTQWNLGNGTKEYPAIAQNAMIGLDDVKTAELVFKSFDVCSVCTTQ